MGKFKYGNAVLCMGLSGIAPIEVREIMSDNEKLAFASNLNLAKVGSKNRVCLPPKLVTHLGIKPGDNVIWVLKTDKNGKNYAPMHPVKEKNFEVEDEEITVEDTFKK